MDESRLQERMARNESLFREANEAIARGLWPGEEGRRVPFRCECARLDCRVAVELTVRDYEAVRAHPRRFIVAPGHVFPEIEAVVEPAAEHLVVEKQGEAGAVAEATDPRAGAEG